MTNKVPPGFGNFFPKGKNGGGARTATKSKAEGKKAETTAEESTQKAQGKPEGGKGGPSMGGGPGNEPPINQISSAALAALGLGLLYTFFGSGDEQMGQEISWQEFKTQYMANGMVERITVVNKQVARVTLRPAVTGFAQDEVWTSDRGTGAESDTWQSEQQ